MILAVQTKGYLIALQNMVITSMISALATLTLAFTASAQSLDGSFLIFYRWPTNFEPKCDDGDIMYAFKVSDVLANPALGCWANWTAFDQFGSWAINGSDTASLNGVTCYITPWTNFNSKYCSAPVTDRNYILSGSDAKPVESKAEVAACKSSRIVGGGIYGVSFSCFKNT